MTKPFDIQDLLSRLQAQGLPVLEKDVVVVVDQALLPWLSDSAALEETSNAVVGGLLSAAVAAIKAPIDAELKNLLPNAAP